jgi:hypothetical protein
MERLWGIETVGTGDLACWQGGKGVPFVTPNRELAESTAQSGEYLEASQPGEQRAPVGVIMVSSAEDDAIMILNEATRQVYCVLRPNPEFAGS